MSGSTGPFRPDEGHRIRQQAVALRQRIDALRAELDGLDDAATRAAAVADVLIEERPGGPLPRFVLQRRQTAHEIGVSSSELLSHLKSRHLVVARAELYWLGVSFYSMSLPQIGRLMGGRDHTTVMHGRRRAQAAFHAAGLTPEAALALSAAERRAIIGAHVVATLGRGEEDQRSVPA